MRQILNTLLLCASLALVGCFSTGCGSTPAAKAAQTEHVVIVSVNAAMSEWRDFVNAGKATRSQIDNVKLAYQSYYVAQQAAKAAIERAVVAGDTAASKEDQVTAQQAVADAETHLLALVNSLIKQ